MTVKHGWQFKFCVFLIETPINPLPSTHLPILPPPASPSSRLLKVESYSIIIIHLAFSWSWRGSSASSRWVGRRGRRSPPYIEFDALEELGNVMGKLLMTERRKKALPSLLLSSAIVREETERTENISR
ncbi:hypothetical protein Trydic_g5227 [Trypoxylus dichotomus]